MKNFKTILILALLLVCGVKLSAQTADDVISKYVQAIGGKEFLAGITSLYTESTMDVMGNSSTQKTTVLNGKGFKQEMEMMGSNIITCVTDKGGWSINPMMGSTDVQDMPDAQYQTSKAQIFIGTPFINYKENGFKAELQGNEKVGDVDAVKVVLTSPDNKATSYFFDPQTGYLLKTVTQSEMQGQQMEITITYSDYKQADGYSVPYKVNMNIGGQFDLGSTVTKVELNKPVDPAIFEKKQ